MVFTKPNPSGWIFQDELTSTQMNLINNDLPNAIDKTNETTASGGGVSGEIDFKSGSSIVLKSGSSQTVSSGATFTNAGNFVNSGTGINSGNFTNSPGALMLLQSGSSLVIDGTLSYNTRAISSNYTVDASGSDLVLLVSTAAAHTITLPAPTAGRIIEIKDSTGSAQTNNITLAPHASETIDGSSGSRTLAINFGTWKLVSDGTNWFFLQLQSVIPARAFTDNGASVFNATGTYQVVIPLTVTPKVTGKFIVSFTGYVINQSNTNAAITTVGLSHGTSSITPDYTWQYIMPVAVAANNSGATLSGILHYDSGIIGITFPVGTPVTFNAICKSNNTVVISSNSMQLSVQEVF